VLAEIPGSLEFFNIVFFAVLFSTLLQGAPSNRWRAGSG